MFLKQSLIKKDHRFDSSNCTNKAGQYGVDLKTEERNVIIIPLESISCNLVVLHDEGAGVVSNSNLTTNKNERCSF